MITNELAGTKVEIIDGVLSVFGEIKFENSNQNNGPANLKVHTQGKIVVIEPNQ
jgi:hypothetical protein